MLLQNADPPLESTPRTMIGMEGAPEIDANLNDPKRSKPPADKKPEVAQADKNMMTCSVK